ncbi:MAG: aminoglycoside phosphotransferase family protein [Burkholderiales bacterium]|nr:aminoglycoside phosphotransferase family protein [Burkholderiales bacterium]
MTFSSISVSNLDTNITVDLVKYLIATQFPQWINLPIKSFASAGTDNAIFKLGNDKMVRLPFDLKGSNRVDKECLWLPKFAPYLPFDIPTPLANGVPDLRYLWHWSVYKWIDGETATMERADLCQMAQDLAKFITAMQQIPSTEECWLSGQHNEFRGVPLITLDKKVRSSIVTLQNILDAKALTAAWDAAIQAPIWHDKPVWLHGDLQSGNLLVKNDKLCAVIDFGLMGIGDPACDLMVGWTLLNSVSRKVFRAALSVDDATWERGRGWALYFGLIALAYYLNTNPTLANISRQTINEVFEDYS